ncbi:Anaphase-promoting complex subunit 23 [Ascosphaera atra]|nr:Anaphase-promoting complex subunit 23 [Ascosphaera atra]
MILGPLDDGRVVNHELTSIAQGLEAWFSDRRAMGLEDQGEGWLEYLYGVVLMKAKNQAEAKEWLIKSVHLYPYNWSAWQELNDLAESVDDLAQIVEDLPQNLMTLIFHLHCSQELYQTTEDIHKILTELEVLFPTNFEEASQIFSEILTAHPYRLDCLDHYSNILYVMEARPQLAFIAQVATEVDKFRPETCCVVGNYYSLRSEHEKAVVYFRRALTLDRSFLSAWTLMGHEYIEMKNTHAAIESYRRGVDVNPKDYRAWYGLGQAYEVLDMVFYALYYYERAAALRPYDPNMWQAVGSCYAKMERFEQSIHALKRAIVASSYYEPTGNGFQSFSSGYRSFGSVPLSKRILDPDILHQIATLYERLNDEETAARYMELTLQQEGGAPAEDDDDTDTLADEDATPGGGNGGRPSSFSQKSNEPEEERIGTGVTASTSKARLWLARWSLKHDDLDRADQLASELCQDGIEVDEAKALIRDVRARKEGDMHD